MDLDGWRTKFHEVATRTVKALDSKHKVSDLNTSPSEVKCSSRELGSTKISVFIPVYIGSDLLEPLLEDLTNSSYRNKEIFVVIDEPDDRSLEIVKKYGEKVNAILSNKRRGKAEALNSAIENSSGEILVFLDADIKIKSRNFFESLIREMREAEILDVKKEIIRDSFISKMVNYEFLSCNIASYLYSKFARKCIALNGVAFAIKRETFQELAGFSKVISEDFDLATKALLRNKRFKYASKVEVCTKAPSSWREWFIQRKRWGIGSGLWLKDYWIKLSKYVAKYPYVMIPSLFILFPTFVPIFLNYVITNMMDCKIPNVLPQVSLMQSSISIQFARQIGEIVLAGLPALFISFFLFSTLFYTVAKKFNFHFDFVEFLMYFFFYQPLASIILFASIMLAFFSEDPKLDWKV